MQQVLTDPNIILLETIREGRVFSPNWLQRRFNAQMPNAAIHSAPEVTAFCESIDYERDGLCEVFNRNKQGLSHSISTIYKNGKLDFIYFSNLIHKPVGDYFPQMSKKAFHVDGLHPFYGRWHEMFSWYGDYIRPVFGKEFQLRMVARSDSELRLHTDHKRYDKIACTPLGPEQKSTVIQDCNGDLIEPPMNSTVITKRGCVHSSPATDKMRVIISAQPIERDLFTGLPMGFGL